MRRNPKVRMTWPSEVGLIIDGSDPVSTLPSGRITV